MGIYKAGPEVKTLSRLSTCGPQLGLALEKIMQANVNERNRCHPYLPIYSRVNAYHPESMKPKCLAGNDEFSGRKSISP